VQSSDTVAVFGCGGVGLGAIAASHFAGARTIAVDLDDHKLEIARGAGAARTVNAAREPLHEHLLQLTENRGPDVVIEAVGLPETFRAAVEEVAFTGRVVYIGYAKEPVAYETRLFVQKELDILGSRNATPADFARVIAMLETGAFPVEQAVGTIVSLEQAPSILRQWSEEPGRFTKIMVSLD
jgi:threonine dehydrogenase-like Zn-dependent dehydrogenase